MGSGEVVAEFFESNEPRSLKGKEAQEKRDREVDRAGTGQKRNKEKSIYKEEFDPGSG